MWMGVDRISANSLTESNIRESELPGKNFNTNPLKHENKLDAAIEEVRREFGNIASTPPETPGTAIVDSVENAERYFANKGDVERKYLVLLSDMFEVSPSVRPLDVLTPGGRRQELDRLEAAGRIPDLRGVEVYVAGAGVDGRQAFAGAGPRDEGLLARAIRSRRCIATRVPIRSATDRLPLVGGDHNAMSSGRTGTRASSRPVASRRAETTAAVETTVGGSPTPFSP